MTTTDCNRRGECVYVHVSTLIPNKPPNVAVSPSGPIRHQTKIFTTLQCKNSIRARFIALLINANNSVIIVGGAQICGFKVHFLVSTYFNSKRLKEAQNWRMAQNIFRRKINFFFSHKRKERSCFSKDFYWTSALKVCPTPHSHEYT